MSQQFIGLVFDGKTYWAKSEYKAAVMELSKLTQLSLTEEKELEDIPADRKNKFFRKNAKWVTLIRKANEGINPIPTDKYWSHKEQSENIEDIHSLEVMNVPVGLPEGVPYEVTPSIDKRIIQIRGTNGSGKSFSINKALKTDPGAYLVVPVGRKNHQAFCTVLPAYRTVLLGPYQPNMGSGGCDRLKGMPQMRNIAHWIVKNILNTGIADTMIFEGSMASSLFGSTRVVFDDHPEINQGVLFCNPTLEQCYKRLEERGSRSSKTVEDKYKAVMTTKRNFLEETNYEVGELDTFQSPEDVWKTLMTRSWKNLRG